MLGTFRTLACVTPQILMACAPPRHQISSGNCSGVPELLGGLCTPTSYPNALYVTVVHRELQLDQEGGSHTATTCNEVAWP